MELLSLIIKSIQTHRDGIKKINDTIWSNPQLAWHETIAHDTICDFFDDLESDYTVHRHAYGIETSFLIQASTLADPPGLSLPQNDSSKIIVFNAEYDALPSMVPDPDSKPPQLKPAHACGHNLIASASIAAFIACWQALKSTKQPGTIRLLGTPAEESGGGKIRLLKASAYLNINACLMAHPLPLSQDASIKALAFTTTLASQGITAEFHGVDAHAGMAPWDGKNALDALVNSYVGISALRQQLKPTNRVSGIITNGGSAANVIPAYTRAKYGIRAETRKELDELRKKVRRCFEAGSEAAGCTVDVDDTHIAYWDMISNSHLCHGFTDRMNQFGIKTVYRIPEITDHPGAASDQGNVSHFCPAMQAACFIDSKGAVNHTPGFAEAAGTEDSFDRSLDCAKGLAAVGFDVLTDRMFGAAIKDGYMLDIARKAEVVTGDSGKEIPSGEEIDRLIRCHSHSVAHLLKPGMKKEEIMGVLMATDALF
ncbi:hypothetical protein BT63DRAFT_191451 [Microthyrium microscopicum]|uniref:Peptidase M20 dimerisation domain-containing protein n=1 Tax=Microthyrium microscopicum TaxID=703497 RepID=A0A6A6UL28_9PEZI|nr:hypothetical protein BT63DRAFT_191451 [Microthyrium microscopicum]